jgi:DNA-binding NarL/FixJ family response regulator
MKLSARDEVLMKLLAAGCCNSEIAREMKISENSVKRRIQRCGRALETLARGTRSVRILLALALSKSHPDGGQPTKPSVQLSDYELRLLDQVLEGKTGAGIAVAFGSQEGAVKQALQRILEKTGMWSRLELALWWRDHRQFYVAGGGEHGETYRSDSKEHSVR